jgi:opacity protein-like surface antigen
MLFLTIVRELFKVIIVPALAFGCGTSFAQDEGTGTEAAPTPGYLPASIYPAVYLFGGTARGMTYGAAPDISGRAAATGSTQGLDDVGAMYAFGFTTDFYLYGGLSAGLKLVHEIAPERTGNLKYDYGTFPKLAVWVTDPPILVEENLAYKLQNVDYKLTLKYAPFPAWPATPYVAVGLGGNSTVMRIEDRVSNPLLQKGLNGALLTNGTYQQFSFDWALYTGAQVNLGDNFFLVAEYNYDHQFREHEFAHYKYNTGLDGYYVGAGWRFLR